MRIDRGERAPQVVIGLHEVVPMQSLSEFFGRAFAQVAEALGRLGVAPAGPPVAYYSGMPEGAIDVTAGFPVAQPVTPTEGLVAVTLSGGATVEATHVGPYDTLGETYGAIAGWLEEQGLTASDAMWEEYLVGPESDADPGRWQTRIVFPLA